MRATTKGLVVSLVALGASFAAPTHVEAQIFSRSPRNFDECITQRMQGTTSDLAARAIYQSCRNLFPEVDLNRPENLVDITGRLVNFTINPERNSNSQTTYYRVFHETQGFGIVSLNIRITDGTLSRNFVCTVTYPDNIIRPGVAGSVGCLLHLEGMDMRLARMTSHTVLGRRI